ncbi:MAG TPA: primosomal protein N' [Candidatus Limnocylindrales bacterium]|nr:primosomal protein N' [Candidatus Limnocylindrales bacterium]
MTEGEKFALVVVPAPLKEPLVYSIPKALEGHLKPGTRVLIPLQKRTVTGIVIEVVGASPVAKTKSIVAPLDEEPIFDHHLLKLARWIAQYYLASLGEVIATMLPAKSRRQSQKTITLEKTEMLNTEGFGRKVLDELQRQKGKMTVKTLAARFPGRSLDRILTRLEALGAIRIDEHLAGQRRKKSQLLAATDLLTINIPVRFDLTTEQDNALRAIESRIKMSGFETFLLHGVTGSGKTEVYIRAMERAKELGRKSLILIPEISLTPQLLDRLHARFPQKVGVLHSALTEAERWAQWQEICHGKVDVVVGARSAVFAPIPGLGLIIVDEEHDSSYKQEDGLRYNGRDVAVVRGKFLNCPVILGSATPALESYENCRHGRYQLLEMTRRVEQRPLPTIEAIDLRRQFRVQARPANAKQSTATTNVNDTDSQLITEPFANALKENLQAGHQTLIFLNRRGFANFLQCTSCGYVWRCPYCSVTLTLHLRLKRISCHHCDYRRPTTDICPQCNHPTLTGIGSGTERIEQALKGFVPQARVARMDRDTTTKRGSHEQLIRRWERGEIDILVGTQMITKGHDVSGVTLVGALLADLSLNLPDFRAAERTFQLLSQVGGRSGRGDNPGRVIVQTYAPDHYAIQHLVRHDYKNFFAAESEFRQALNYPPFSRLVNLRIDGPKLSEVEEKSQELALQLRELKTRKPEVFAQIEVLGPAAAPIEKLRNRYRWQLLLRGKQSSALLEFARQARQLWPPGRAVRLHIDVDPYSML